MAKQSDSVEPAAGLVRRGGVTTLVAAGVEVISEQGFHAASIRGIARRAGMSTANLYHHFDSKQELLASIIESALEALLEVSEEALEAADKDPESQLRALVHAHVKQHALTPGTARNTNTEMRHLPEDQRRRMRERMRDQQRRFYRVVEEGAAAGVFATPRPHDTARAVASMCTAVWMWFDPRGSLTPEEVGARYEELALVLVELRR
jgi:AcrR family transcriptional regulator